MSPLPHPPARTRWLLPLLSAAAVGAIVIATIGVSALRAGTGPSRPPVLHLASVAIGSAGVPAVSAAGAPGTGQGGAANIKGSGWRLEGALPKGPSSGQVHL